MRYLNPSIGPDQITRPDQQITQPEQSGLPSAWSSAGGGGENEKRRARGRGREEERERGREADQERSGHAEHGHLQGFLLLLLAQLLLPRRPARPLAHAVVGGVGAVSVQHVDLLLLASLPREDLECLDLPREDALTHPRVHAPDLAPLLRLHAVHAAHLRRVADDEPFGAEQTHRSVYLRQRILLDLLPPDGAVPEGRDLLVDREPPHAAVVQDPWLVVAVPAKPLGSLLVHALQSVHHHLRHQPAVDEDRFPNRNRHRHLRHDLRQRAAAPLQRLDTRQHVARNWRVANFLPHGELLHHRLLPRLVEVPPDPAQRLHISEVEVCVHDLVISEQHDHVAPHCPCLSLEAEQALQAIALVGPAV
mmetsp:Transcript_40101/g.95195  ORF Transcript_40101/g.95195 Transcript_40101/m.95195 type:complete len:364 (-) Transcript_40101:555-1646(-)